MQALHTAIEAVVDAMILFVPLSLGEYLVARGRGVKLYDLKDTLANVSFGLVNAVWNAFFLFLPFIGYVYAYHQYRFFDLDPRDPITPILAILGVELALYAWHRFSHRVALMWCIHQVHHQSLELNLSHNMRISWFHGISYWIFFLPIAFLGVPPEMIFVLYFVSNLVAYITHCRLIPQLGPLEWFLITPSAHRVHHGADPKYVDKNYGSFLPIWDQLLGTWQREEEEPNYGIGRAEPFHGPLDANVYPFVRLARRAADTPGLWGKLKVVFGPPSKEDTTRFIPPRTDPHPVL